MRSSSATSGAALPMVLFALAISSALAVGGLYVARQLAASALVGQRGGEVEPAVEGFLATAFAQWDSTARTRQSIGSTEQLTNTLETSLVRAQGWVTRMSELDYWLVSEASTRVKPLLRRRLGLVVHITQGFPAPVPLRAWVELP